MENEKVEPSSWTHVLGSGVNRERAKQFPTLTDFALHSQENETVLKESIVLPKDATESDFRKALKEKGVIPKEATIYETVKDADFEKPLKKKALERGYTQKEYNTYVNRSIEKKQLLEENRNNFKKSFGIKDDDIESTKNIIKSRLESLPDKKRSEISFSDDELIKLSVLLQKESTDTSKRETTPLPNFTNEVKNKEKDMKEQLKRDLSRII